MSDEEKNQKPSIRTRRDALRVVGAAAAGAVAGAVSMPKGAAAADSSPLVLGQANDSSSTTSLDSSVVDGDAVVVNATASGSGLSVSGGGAGVSADGVIGVIGFGDVGGMFAGSTAAIGLSPQPDPGPPADAGFNAVGDLVVDSEGVLYLCVRNSPAAEWARVAPAGIQLLTSPVRAYNSRDTGGKFSDGATRTVAIAGTNGVPADAVGLLGNLTVTETGGGGYATIYPAGTTRPQTSSVNYTGVNQDVANSFTVRLGGGAVAVYVYASTHIILDIVGYIL